MKGNAVNPRGLAAARRSVVLWGVVALAGLGLAPVISYGLSAALPVIPADGFVAVTEAPMSVVVQETGDLESSSNKIIVSRCEWRVSVLWLAPEGSFVNAGDVIVELDSSELRHKAKEREVQLLQARAALTLAEAEVDIRNLDNESTRAAAKLQALVADLDLDGYCRAQFPQERRSLEIEVAVAQEALNAANERYDFVSRMVPLGYRSATQREAERINLEAAEKGLHNVTNKLRVLTEFTRDRQLSELTALAREGHRNVQRVDAVNKATELNNEVRVQAARKVVEDHRAFLDRLERSIAACTIRAPQSGQVIYTRQSWRSNRNVEPGDEIRFLRPIVKLPNRDRMQVSLRVHESKISRVLTGQPAEITTELDSRRCLVGHVMSVSTVPLPGRFPNFDRREYQVVVQLDEPPDVARRLPPGTTARVEIYTAHRRQALQAPVNSVVTIADRDFAFVKRGDQVEAREVEVGLISEETVEILDGLRAGQEIVLAPRVTCARQMAMLQSRLLAQASAPTTDTASP